MVLVRVRRLISLWAQRVSYPAVPFGVGGRKDGTNVTTPGQRIYVLAVCHETIEKCYEKGLQAGGIDNGKPGPRPMF